MATKFSIKSTELEFKKFAKKVIHRAKFYLKRRKKNTAPPNSMIEEGCLRCELILCSQDRNEEGGGGSELFCFILFLFLIFVFNRR